MVDSFPFLAYFFIFPVVTVIGFLIASFFDLRIREIPPLLSYSLIFIGLGGHAVFSALTWNMLFIIQSLVLCALCFMFAFSLYKLGVWAGGDVKLFTALGALLPAFGSLQLFPFFALAAALLAFFPFAIAYALYHFVKQKKLRAYVRNEFMMWLKRAFITPFYLISSFFICMLIGIHWIITLPLSIVLFKAKMYAIPMVAFFSLWALYSDYVFFLQYLVYILIMSAIFFIGIASFRTLKKHVLREKVKVSDLEEGAIPIITSELKKAGITRLARGLTNDEINKLKKEKIKNIVVMRSMPFTPILTLGIIILIFAELVV